MRQYRGTRAGWHQSARRPCLCPVKGGASVLVPRRQSVRSVIVSSKLCRQRQLIEIPCLPPDCCCVFGCQNIRSINSSIDDVIALQRDQKISILCLVETWHDQDSVALRRLRVAGCQVVDRPRPRVSSDTLAVNHGGVAVIAKPGIRLAFVSLGLSPSSFEVVGARAIVGSKCFSIIVIYRPGSIAVSQVFFDELADLLDRAATTNDELYIVGDLNIRLDRQDDVHAKRLLELLEGYGLEVNKTGPTHKCGGQLDVVVTRTGQLGHGHAVSTLDNGLSDHKMLVWSTKADPVVVPVVSVTSRSWRTVNIADFCAALTASPLCSHDEWVGRSADDLVQLYDTVLTDLADRFAPARTTKRRPRPSDPWFDAECRCAKRLTRRLERAAAAAARHHDTVAASASEDAWIAQRRVYRDIIKRKRETFWRSTVEAQRSRPKQLWSSIDTILGRGRIPVSNSIDANEFHKFFDDKVEAVRASTATAPAPSFTQGPIDITLTEFEPVDRREVIEAIHQLPDNCCAVDPVPTSILKQVADDIAPFLVTLMNRSMADGVVPAAFKTAYITPLLKKPDLDAADVRSYRPISNLSVISKLTERRVARRLLAYLTSNKLLPCFQSAYRPYHSTETAVLKVLDDILTAIDNGDLAGLALLDLSAAFDTVDHDVLLRRLQISYGIGGAVLDWFRSYLADRRQYVRLRTGRSSTSSVSCGVPQGSVLGPILFILYTADLVQLVEHHGLNVHLYADDTQIYGCSSPSSVDLLQFRMSACIDDVVDWMSSNRLQMNATKTEVLWCSSARRQHQLLHSPFRVCGDYVTPAAAVRDLGIFIDSDVSMRTHVSRTVSTCFGILRRLRSIRRSLPDSVFQSIVVALVLTRLDYGNASLAGCPAYQLRRLQAVLNAAARLVFQASHIDHVTPLLRRLHWLRAAE